MSKPEENIRFLNSDETEAQRAQKPHHSQTTSTPTPLRIVKSHHVRQNSLLYLSHKQQEFHWTTSNSIKPLWIIKTTKKIRATWSRNQWDDRPQTSTPNKGKNELDLCPSLASFINSALYYKVQTIKWETVQLQQKQGKLITPQPQYQNNFCHDLHT